MAVISYLCRVENRNDEMFPAMKQYVEAFSEENEKENMASETSTMTRSVPGNSNRESLSGWKLIRCIILGHRGGEPGHKNNRG